jgi:hypothetical protein
MRDNKNSTVFKCRHIIEVDGKKKNVLGTLLILGCHFHFTSAINKKIGDLGPKIVYVGENRIEKFTTWVRMLMAFPFLLLDDIDEVWEEMIDSKPDS